MATNYELPSKTDVTAHPVTATVEARAAATVRRYALDADDRQELLDALGLPASLADDPPGP